MLRQVLSSLVLAFAMCSNGQSQVTAVPMQSRTPQLRFPRVSGLWDAKVQGRVNAALAHREAEDLKTLEDCSHWGETPAGKGEDFETTRVTYLTSLFLSVNVHVTVWTCAPYPQPEMPNPLTIDLRTGRKISWSDFFVPGFLPSHNQNRTRSEQDGPVAELTRLYLKHYKEADEGCVVAVKDDTSYGYALWLDRRRKALLAVPNFPHVIQSCADEVAIPLSEVLPYVAEKAAAADLGKRGARPIR